jgi:hypothetical protein
MLAARRGPVNAADFWYRESGLKLAWARSEPRSGASSAASKIVRRARLRAPGGIAGGGAIMDQLIERCAGLDVHRDTVAACVRVPGRGGRSTQTVQTFGTTAADSSPYATGWKRTA